MDIEKIKLQLAIGEPILKHLSLVHPNKIQRALETIAETYMDSFPKHVQDEFSDYLTFRATYKKDKTLDSANLIWSCWDKVEILLNSIGVKIIFQPEHQSPSVVADLPWNIVKDYFIGLIQD